MTEGNNYNDPFLSKNVSEVIPSNKASINNYS